MITIREFQEKFVNAIQNKSAAVFAGAGLGVASGYVDWKHLMRNFANFVKLDIEKEQDLIEVAQFYKNERGSRYNINQHILSEFTKLPTNTTSVDLLASMPISCFWTTNYDKLIENSLLNAGKKIDVKINPASLSVSLENSDATVYKMHGDVSVPSECIITKDDYETYYNTHQLFSIALQGHLVSKTFLFIGFSFNDPNLNYILARIRALVGENVREHYFLVKGVKRCDFHNEEDYNYYKNKHLLKINDLKRYGIQAVEIEDYSQIPDILLQIKRKAKTKNVFISGAAHNYGQYWTTNGQKLIKELTEMLYEKDYKIVTGHARGIGSYIIGTILDKTQSNLSLLESHLLIKAFPYEMKNSVNYDRLTNEYREGIAKISGIAIFIFGNKLNENGEQVLADGMREEFLKAQEHNCYIIPVGSTGYVAKELFNEVMNNKHKYPYLTDEDLFLLGNSIDTDEIVYQIGIILDRISSI